MKFCSSPALEATCAGAAAPKFAVFAEAGPGWLASARDPLGGKERPRRTCFFLLPRAWSVGPLARAPKMWQPDRGRGGRSSPTAGGKTGRWPRVWRRSGQPRRPFRHRRAPPGRPLQRPTDAPAAPAQGSRSPNGAGPAAGGLRQFGRSTSHGLEPRGTRVWQFDPVDGIVYCGARGRRVSLLGGQVELDPLEDGGFRA